MLEFAAVGANSGVFWTYDGVDFIQTVDMRGLLLDGHNGHR